MNPDYGSDGYGLSFRNILEPYEPSIASSVSSSQASVFSEALSSQSSIASSVSDDFRGSQEDARERDRICARVQVQQQVQAGLIPHEEPSVLSKFVQNHGLAALSYADVTSVPPEQRQHPRRCSQARAPKPPPLIRQRDRKVTFVENLVDSATQMVEVIWPISVVPCKTDSNGRGVLPLRTYIEETLRRSRTSYSTLQVALYYLILIKPSVPQGDFTMEQKMDCPGNRALMCGRRMFLAALILASKYLQDRNYSAKAWSKMSGLKVSEINTNERTFLSMVNWKLHIPKPTFEKWQEFVLRFTPTPQPPSPGGLCLQSSWKSIVPLLTPELDNLPSMEHKLTPVLHTPETIGFSSPATPTPTNLHYARNESVSLESTPTPTTMPPRFLEPKPELAPPTPALARLGPLPTPQMTPWSVASSTPAASACSSRRPSMCSAMALAQKTSLNRCTLDACPSGMDSRFPLSRRQSVMSLTSSGSSPESVMLDLSRSSRSSSISSASTVASSVSSVAPQRACLARQATCRNVRLPIPGVVREEEKETCDLSKITANDDDVDMGSSPDYADFSIGEKALHAPHRHSKHAPHHAAVSAADKGRKRCRSRGHRRSELHEEVRYLLQESYEDDSMDVDDQLTSVSPSSAAAYASTLLSRYSVGSNVNVESQPVAQSSYRDFGRVSVPRGDGKKRTCYAAPGVPNEYPYRYQEVA